MATIKARIVDLLIGILCIGILCGVVLFQMALFDNAHDIQYELFNNISPDVEIIELDSDFSYITTDKNNKTQIKIEPFIVRPGDIITLRFPTKLYSINNYWASSNVVFEPILSEEQIAKGIKMDPIIGTGEANGQRFYQGWSSTISCNPHTEYGPIIPYTKIKLPNNLLLEGETIEGVLKMDIKYPRRSGYGYDNINVEIEQQIVIHIFSKDEIERFHLPHPAFIHIINSADSSGLLYWLCSGISVIFCFMMIAVGCCLIRLAIFDELE